VALVSSEIAKTCGRPPAEDPGQAPLDRSSDVTAVQ
jgi:hypothetical protein